MTAYVIRRLLGLVPTLLLITVITFVIIKLSPGDPLAQYAGANVDPAQLARLRQRWGLDDPLHVQYWRWLTNFLRGDLGVSLSSNRPVLAEVKERFPATALLAASALTFALVVAVPLGTLSALRPPSTVDHLASGLALMGLAMPNFWLGLLLLWAFSVRLRWLPSFGLDSLDVQGGWRSAAETGRRLIMPTVVLGTAGAAAYMRFLRASLMTVLRSDYIRTARAAGLPEKVVLYRHALKNALLPLITMLGMDVPVLLSGALVTEQVFGWPGLGFYTWRSVMSRDYPAIMGVLTIAALLTLLCNLAADIAYALLDPRIRYD